MTVLVSFINEIIFDVELERIEPNPICREELLRAIQNQCSRHARGGYESGRIKWRSGYLRFWIHCAGTTISLLSVQPEEVSALRAAA